MVDKQYRPTARTMPVAWAYRLRLRSPRAESGEGGGAGDWPPCARTGCMITNQGG